MTIDKTLIVPLSLPLQNPGLDRKQLIQTNPNYLARTTCFKVYDHLQGRREIAPNTGEVQVCVGFKKGRDEYGLRTETPVYRTQRF